ncbi:hypothetical protein DM860_004365 [Cuscuta australis]|uniref:Uncharacterized protein n=1 Tax=Cuscuta australis TaxID=267555 RepID=A0A328E7D1_9ASTE|nr:hypothetical protein DM860_004365 [Cuscuta australis]
MLQLFFAMAFSAVPLTLYIPPVRRLNLFMESVETLRRESATHAAGMSRDFNRAFFGIFNCFLPL